MILHTILALVGYFIFSAMVGSMYPPSAAQEPKFYGWFYRTMQRLAANADRLAQAKFGSLAGLPANSESALPVPPPPLSDVSKSLPFLQASNAAQAEESTMSTSPVVLQPSVKVHVPFWQRVEAKAERLFHMLPKWEVVASDALKVSAPILEEVLAVEDPALGAVIAPIITTIQTKLATAGVLIDDLEKSTSLTSALTDVQANISTILNLAEVKSSTSAAKITEQLALLSSVVASIEGAVGTPTAPGVTAAAAPVAVPVPIS